MTRRQRSSPRWPALWVALGRIGLGALTLVILVWRRRESLRFEPRLWVGLVVAAVFFTAVPCTLFAYGETKVSSIVAGLWNGSTPLWVLFAVVMAFGEERPDRRRVLGLAVGFLGVGPWQALGQAQLIGQLACAGAAACYGVCFSTPAAISRAGPRAAWRWRRANSSAPR